VHNCGAHEVQGFLLGRPDNEPGAVLHSDPAAEEPSSSPEELLTELLNGEESNAGGVLEAESEPR
jgi:hypothetical protein